MVVARVKAGHVFLNWQLRKIITSWGMKIPKKGSGKGGRVKNVDLVRVLVERFLADWSKEAREAHILKMAGRSGQSQEVDPEDRNLLEAVSLLDEKERGNFRDLVDKCVNELEKESARNRARKKLPPEEPTVPKGELASSSSTVPHAPASSAAAADAPAADEPAPEDLPKAHVRSTPEVSKESKKGGSRVPAPPELLELLPKVPGMYLKWMEKDRRVTIEFVGLIGTGFQRTKTSSWPFYCGLGPKENALYTILRFVELTVKAHYKDVDPSWRVPTRERILEQVTKLVNRLASA